MRLLHTADWQLGAHLAFLGERAAAARDKRFETLATLVDLARSESVDCVLVAGDIFDSPDVPEDCVRRALEILGGLGDVPVVLLPGNHDPAVPGGIWDRTIWEGAPANVIRALRPREIEILDGLALYPCPIDQKTSRLDPTRWIPHRDDGDTRLRIGLAHGALDVLPRTGNFPIAVSRAAEAGLDYLALGDWHTPWLQDRIAYSGSHEPGSFRERDSGHVLLVELAGVGEPPQIEQRRVGALVWQKHVRRIDDLSDLRTLADGLHADRAQLVLQLELEVGDAAVLQPVEELLEQLRDETFFLRAECETLLPQRLDEIAQPLTSELDAELVDALEQLRGSAPDAVPSDLEVDGVPMSTEELVEARRQLLRLAQRAASEGAAG